MSELPQVVLVWGAGDLVLVSSIVTPASVSARKMTPAVPVRVSYAQLRHQPDSCSLAIEEAFGASEGSLGIIVVEGESSGTYTTTRICEFYGLGLPQLTA